MEIHDGEGIRTTVFFKGCPLKCIWCHNPESISSEKQLAFFADKCISCGSCYKSCTHSAISFNQYPLINKELCTNCFVCQKNCPTNALMSYGDEWELDDLESCILQDRVFFETSKGGITLSGGECLRQGEFVTELSKSLYMKGISVNIDTCGFVNKNLIHTVMPYIDTFLYDIKAIDSNLHKSLTGQDNKLILDNLKHLSESGCNIEIRYLLVKGYNDGECEKIGEFLQHLNGIKKVQVLRYHSLAASRYKALNLKNTLPHTETTDSDMLKAIDALKKFNLNVSQ